MSALDDAIRARLESPVERTRNERLAAAAVAVSELGKQVRASLISAGVPTTPSYVDDVEYGGYYTGDTHTRREQGGAWPLQVFALRDDDGDFYQYWIPYPGNKDDYRTDVWLQHAPAFRVLIEDGPSANDMIACTPTGELRLMTTHQRKLGAPTSTVSLGLDKQFPPGTRDRPADYPLDEVLGYAIADLIRFYA